MIRRRGKIHGIQRNVRHQKLHQKQRQSTSIRTKLKAISEIAAKHAAHLKYSVVSRRKDVIQIFELFMFRPGCRISLSFSLLQRIKFRLFLFRCAVSEHYRCCAGIVCPVCWCSLCLAVCMSCPLWPNAVCVQCGNVCLIPSWSSDICGRVLSRRAVPAMFCVFVLYVIVSVFMQSITQ